MSKKTLNKANLEALGAGPLADLLLEVSEGSADIKRRLRLELSHSLGAAELAHDLRKRLASLRKSGSFVSWRKRKALVKDLETQAAMIVEKIAAEDPETGFDLLWEFVELAPFIDARVDDSRGEVRAVFRDAVGQFAPLAPRVMRDPEALAEQVWAVLRDEAGDLWQGIITLIAPALGAPGLAHLKARLEAYGAQEAAQEAAPEEHVAIRFLRELRAELGHGESFAAEKKARFVKACLQEIATAAGDVDGYSAQFSEAERARKDVAAEIAERLLAQERAQDALAALKAADPLDAPEDRWDAAYIASLSALGQVEAAQAHRWACFEARLSAPYLREYLKLLPDFDDVEAEHRAKRLVLAAEDPAMALRFCLDWPDLFTAAELVFARAEDLDGGEGALLTQAVEALRARHPLAAMLLLRAMIDDTLDLGRAARYAQAAEHLADCTALDAQIADYGAVLPHHRYHSALQAEHARKTSFWDLLP